MLLSEIMKFILSVAMESSNSCLSFPIIYLNLRATELWTLDGDGFSTATDEPVLEDYKAYPELFLIEEGYCV